MNYNNVVPPTSNGLTPNLPRNRESIIGSKLGTLVNDQIMPMSNFVLHNSKMLLDLGRELTNLFSYLISRIKSFHPFFNLKCLSFTQQFVHIYNQKVSYCVYY